MRAFFVLALGLSLGACSHPSINSAVYSLSSNAVVMRPPDGMPSDLKKSTSFTPGSIVRVRKSRMEATSSFWKTAAEWGMTSTRWCSVPSSLYTLADTRVDGNPSEILIDYDFDTSRWSILDWIRRGPPPDPGVLRAQAAQDLDLPRNGLRSVRRIKIHIVDIRPFVANDKQLADAAQVILKKCGRLLTGPRVYQLTIMYSGALYSVQVEALDGAAIDVGIVEARVARRFKSRTIGTNVFFALEAIPVSGAQ